MQIDLLPPNATPIERALVAATARIGAVDAPIAPLLDPTTCPIDLLPFLAWALSVDVWNPSWPEATKRQAVASSIALHRVKGTRLSVETVLARFDRLAHLVEWHEASPRLAPHTFEIMLPLAGEGVEPGGERATAAFAEAIVADIARIKPLREHLTFVQALEAAGGIGIQAVARSLAADRRDMALVNDTSQPWDALLQAETGEPLEDDASTFLETRP